MISFLKEWTLGVCVTVLACAIVFAVSPSGSVKKALRTVIAIIVICSIILPFANTGLDMDFDLSEYNFNNEVYSNELESAVEYQITAAYADDITEKTDYILSSAGMSNCEITLMTDINDKGSIFIKKAFIKLPDTTLRIDDKTKKELSGLFGEQTIIVFN